MTNSPYKVAVFTSHPTQYHAPIFKLATARGMELIVYYTWHGNESGQYDAEFGQRVKWDIPLLEGYRHREIRNWNPKPKPSFFGQFSPGAICELRRERFDAVVLFGYMNATNVLVLLTKWWHRTPVILRGEADLNKRIGVLKRMAKKVILSILFKFVDAFLYSYGLNKKFFEAYGAPDEKMFFYPCAVDNDYFQNEKKRIDVAAVKRELGMVGDTPVILFSGKLMDRKRPLDLLEAYGNMAESLPDAAPYLVFVGDGALRGRMETYIKERGLKRVIITGFKNQSELPRYYALADIFALPSEFDPSPKALNEVMNFGVAVLTTTGVGTAPDLVGTECGFIYEVGDVETLAKHLKKLIQDRGLLEKMKRNTLQKINDWNIAGDVRGLMQAIAHVKR